MSTRATILSKITAFCEKHGFSRSAFGREAVGDRAFIRQLELGKPVTLGRIEQAEAFMAGHLAAQDQPREIAAAEAAEEQGEVGDRVEHGDRIAAGGRRRQREALP